MTSEMKASDDTGAKTHKRNVEKDPADVLDRSGTNNNAYNISLWTVSKSKTGSKASASPSDAYYRIQDDHPRLLLKADNLLKCLKREFGLSGIERYDGDGFEIVIEPTNIPNGLSTAQKTGQKVDCTVVEGDSISLMPVVEEFIQEANSKL